MADSTAVRYGTAPARWVLFATIAGSAIVTLDGTVVNVALPAIGRDFHAGVAGLQWVLTSYGITLSALILLGGSLGDLYGRRRVFLVGVAWFGAASLLCAVAPDLNVLIAARALQGAGGALLVPGSLAIIEATFRSEDRGRAIGTWSALGGVAAAVGPLVGGWLVTAVTWRLIFVLNLPLAVAVFYASRHVPESKDPTSARHLDLTGAVLAVVGLASTTYALIEGPAPGSDRGLVVLTGVLGVAALVAFLAVERRVETPMLELDLFRSRQFTVSNVLTFLVYGALGAVLFLLVVNLEVVLGYSALAAGASLLPLTLVMLLFSSRAGALASRIGPRLPMSLGPAIMAGGLFLMVRIGVTSSYLADVLPAVLVFSAGLALTVAPLTTTVMGAVDDRHSGAASGVNNAVARVAGLLAVAVIPPAVGLTGIAFHQPARFSAGFHRAAVLGGFLCLAGALIALVGLVNPKPAKVPAPAGQPLSCPLDAPGLRPARTGSA
ncbi:MAG TPA: MFS transporter [Acidimicrobiales bacterium]|nr:MFS transporter [Acidimicrobiales bacterium]